MTLATISRAEPRMAPQPIKKARKHKPRPAFTRAQRAAALASLAAAEKPETLRRRTRRVEIIPQTGAPQGALAEVLIKREAHGRRLRFRDDHVEVPLANSEQFVRVAILDWHWLHHAKGISRRKWTRGEHGEIRAPLDTTRRIANHYYGYDYDVGALLLGLKQGDCYEMDYSCSLMPDTIRQVPRSRSRKKARTVEAASADST
ncbi:hypothetical protein I6G56_11715 [Burkholderia humptydooensis]|uniref:Uncharacterized protein n=1 Tax=Burkholderia humptydooensis TaxID=430531 RepID=A0A7U4P3X5_9BURK|nr:MULTISPECIES: hypothetical protein [Burkholderia]AJY40835.1 hypothetical protein BW21_1868 [Burkholderia sp. 2002721687]ALX42491.1 hypothetical protein AQ610_08710 [Burkholderia humptydooensis]QPS42295.1 hypothetical protein I6G56_11715 [Burkholderia humptydooensis]